MCLFTYPILPIITDNGINFMNQFMDGHTTKLGLQQDFSSPYYPQCNGQVEAINKVLKTMLQCTVDKNKTNWNMLLLSALWAYHNSTKTATGFTPFHLVYGDKVVFPIECEIPSLKIAIELLPNTSVEEKRLLHLHYLDETRREASLNV